MWRSTNLLRGFDTVIVYVDDREPVKVQKLCKKHLGTVEVAHLPVGDIVCNDIVIERKTVPDFVSSENEGRLAAQVDNMIRNFEKRWIVTVGEMSLLWQERYRKFRPKRFKSTLIQYQTVGINTIETRNDSEFINTVASILKYAGDTQYQPEIIKKRLPRTHDRYIDMIRAGVDGIGPKKAHTILKEFKIWELWEISEKDLCSIDGIGPVQAKKIKKVFRKGTHEN
jgi:Fanconi anemia group M protein